MLKSSNKATKGSEFVTKDELSVKKKKKRAFIESNLETQIG